VSPSFGGGSDRVVFSAARTDASERRLVIDNIEAILDVAEAHVNERRTKTLAVTWNAVKRLSVS
jgi:hypothetical protein